MPSTMETDVQSVQGRAYLQVFPLPVLKSPTTTVLFDALKDASLKNVWLAGDLMKIQGVRRHSKLSQQVMAKFLAGRE